MHDDELFSMLTRAALHWPSSRAVVAVRGTDARGFLHRMSTQHVEGLLAEEARLSTLTNKQGRLVDLVHHVNVADDEVLLIGTKADGASLVEWLDGFLFVEKVELHDLTKQGAVSLLAGEQAFSVASKLLGRELSLGAWAAALGPDSVVVRGFDLLSSGGPVPSLIVWRGAGNDADLAAALEAAGAQAAPASAWEWARVAAGVPGPAEVTERYNPLELSLHDAIHWAKGCYIGQEVIARIDNYGKQSRQLVGVTLDDDGALDVIAPGAEVRSNGKVVGEVTSVSPKQREGLPSALAVVKLRGDIDGTVLEIASESGSTVRAVARRRAAEQTPHD